MREKNFSSMRSLCSFVADLPFLDKDWKKGFIKNE